MEKIIKDIVRVRKSYNNAIAKLSIECQKYVDWCEIAISDFPGDGLAVMDTESGIIDTGVPINTFILLIKDGKVSKKDFEKHKCL